MLIDAGKRMQAFAADISSLIDDTVRFVGYDRLQVMWFHDNPSNGVYAADGEEIRPYRMPGLGDTVLLVSDLGVGTARDPVGGRDFSEWLNFAEAAQHHKCALTAIVPYSASHIPGELRTRMRILIWDRTTGVRDLHRGGARAVAAALDSMGAKGGEPTSPAAIALAMRASLAARAEPQLLRKLRLEVEPVLDVSAEADIYWSPLVDIHGSAGIVLRADVLDDLRQRLSSSTKMLDACWEVTKGTHQDGPRAILYEEELTYLTLRGLDDPSRKARAQLILRELVGSLRGGRLALWGERAVLRLPRVLFENVEESRMLAIGVARSSGNQSIWRRLPVSTDSAAYPWLATATRAFRRIYVGLVEGGIAFASRQFAESHQLAVTRGGPLDVELIWVETDQFQHRMIRLDHKLPMTIDIEANDLEIRPAGAARYRIISDMSDIEPPFDVSGAGAYQKGRALRAKTPLEAHAELHGPLGRDPVAILAESDAGRVAELLPLRYKLMTADPFAFLRGAAAVMATDLAHQPLAGVPVQACGDCHLMNFGAFNSPEGNILFDINDFDETMPGVDFTIDLKRLAASVAVAALAASMSDKQARSLATSTVSAYREHMFAPHEHFAKRNVA